MSSDHRVVGYVPGVFDMFHIGHLNILRRSRERCDWLIAGVVDDETVIAMKGHPPIVPLAERLEVVASNRFVDQVVTAHSADKREAWYEHEFDVVFKGNDWLDTDKGRLLEEQMSEIGVRVEYLPYTKNTSSTVLRNTLEQIETAL